MTLFEKFMKVILENEGGYVNDPDDPGGETKYGITAARYPDLNIRELTQEDAIKIYKRDFYDPMNLGGIKNKEARLHILDMGINAGPKRAIKLAQGVANVAADGIIGPITTEAINGHDDFLRQYQRIRCQYYINLAQRKPVMMKFLKGWINRVFNTHL